MTTLISSVLTTVDIDGVPYRVDIHRVSQMRCFKIVTDNAMTVVYRVTRFDEGEQRVVCAEPCDLDKIWTQLAMACIRNDQPLGLVQYGLTWEEVKYISDVKRQAYRLEGSGKVVSVLWRLGEMRFVATNIRQLNSIQDLLPLIPTAQK